MIPKCTNCQNGCNCKCKKYIYFILEGFFALLIIIGLIVKFSTKEDTWLCDDGVWVKHGNPSAEMPKTGCGEDKTAKVVSNFSECEAAGFPVMESYPRQCQGKDMVYVSDEAIDDKAETAKKDLIKLNSVHAGSYLTSPVVISGEARGNWFFEASFPVSLVNWDGLIIAEGIAQAKSDWMTEDFVPFEVTLTFDRPTYKNNGFLILKKDNPSGLPANDDYLEIPVFFK